MLVIVATAGTASEVGTALRIGTECQLRLCRQVSARRVAGNFIPETAMDDIFAERTELSS